MVVLVVKYSLAVVRWYGGSVVLWWCPPSDCQGWCSQAKYRGHPTLLLSVLRSQPAASQPASPASFFSAAFISKTQTQICFLDLYASSMFHLSMFMITQCLHSQNFNYNFDLVSVSVHPSTVSTFSSHKRTNNAKFSEILRYIDLIPLFSKI